MRQEILLYKDMSRWERTARTAAQNPGWHDLENDPTAQAKAEVDPAILEQMGSFHGYPWREVFTRIQCPGLLITGDPSARAIVTPETARQAAELWKNGQVAQIAGAGHCIHRDRYPETMRVVNEFLERQRK